MDLRNDADSFENILLGEIKSNGLKMMKKLFFILLLSICYFETDAQIVASSYQGANFLTKNLNNALDFDGIDDHVLTTLDVNYSAIPITTWEAWVYPTANNAEWRTIFGIEDGGWDRNLFVNAGWFHAGYGSNGWQIVQAKLNEWQHVALVYDEAGGKITFYLNGTKYSLSPGVYAHNSAQKFAIGASQQSGPNQFFKGKISEVRVWNLERTQAQIQANMNSELTGEESGLVSYYPFKQGNPNQINTNTVLYDEVGGYNGTITNLALSGTTSNFTFGKIETTIPKNNLIAHLSAAYKRSYGGTSTVLTDLTENANNFTINSPTYSSNYGGVINYYGSTSFVSVNNNPLAGTKKRTIALWVMPNSFNRYDVNNFLFSGSSANNGGAFGLFVNSNNMLSFWGHNADVYNSNLYLKMNEWNFIAITYDGSGKLLLHLNGASKMTNVTLNTVLNKLNFMSDMRGSFAEMYIYDRDLSQSDLEYIYKKNKDKYPAPNGLTQYTAAVSAKAIKAAYPSATDGVYWIDLPTVGIQQVYCLMDSKYDGGGWMMAMKATTGGTFNYAANYWYTANTLNPNELNRNDGDAKYDVMNYYPAKDMLALWPDIGASGTESGSIDNLTNWSWLQNNFHNSGATTTLISKFAASPTQSTFETNFSGSITFSGFGTPFSSQPGFAFYGFNYQGNANSRLRWGFTWNQEADQGTNDVSSGIGLNARSYSAGDIYGCCGNYTGINRAARVEMYIR